MPLTKDKFKTVFGKTDYSGLAKSQAKQKKKQEEESATKTAEKSAKASLKAQKEKGIGLDDAVNLGKGLVAGVQQMGGRLADTGMQAATVVEEVKRSVDPFKSSKQKDFERNRDVAGTDAARKALHSLKDINGNKIGGTSSVDKAANKIATGKASVEDVKDVGVMGLAVGADATSLINPVAMASRSTGGRVVKDVANNALVGAIGGGSSAAAEETDVLSGIGFGALGGGALAGAGHALGGLVRKAKGGKKIAEAVTPVAAPKDKSILALKATSESVKDIDTQLDNIYKGSFSDDMYDVKTSDGATLTTDDITRATQKQIDVLEKEKAQLSKQIETANDVAGETAITRVNEIDDQIASLQSGDSNAIMQTFGEGTTRQINPERVRATVKDLTSRRELATMQAKADSEFQSGNVRPVEEIDAELTQLNNGQVPDTMKTAHPKVESVADIAFSDNMPAELKAHATKVMDDTGIVDQKLETLMTKQKYDDAHLQMDQAYLDRQAAIEAMPAPRQEMEQAKLDEQYMADLDELEQKFVDDTEDVANFTTIKEHLAAKEQQIIRDTNTLINDSPDSFIVTDKDAVSARIAQLENEKNLSTFTKEQSPVNQQLVGSVENGVKPSQSTNPATIKAVEDAQVGSTNLDVEAMTAPMNKLERTISNIGNSSIVEKFLGVPREVMKKWGPTGSKISETLSNAYDNVTISDHKMTRQVQDWFKRAGRKDGMESIAKALDGDLDTFAKLNPEQQSVFNEVRDMFKKYADNLGLPEEARIANYLPHIFGEAGMNNIDLAMKQLSLGKNMSGKTLTQAEITALNKTIRGVSYEALDMIKRNSLYTIKNGFLEKRTGVDGYSFNLADILLTYTHSAHETMYLKPAFTEVKGLSTQLEEGQNEYLARAIQSIGGRPSSELSDTLNKSLEKIWSGKNITYSNASAKARNAIYNATLGYNVGSAVRNLGQGANTYAQLGAKYYASGTASALKSLNHANGMYDELIEAGVLHSKYSDMLRSGNVTGMKNANDRAMWSMFTNIEQINRATAYFGTKDRFIDDYMKTNGIKSKDLVPESVINEASKAGREMSRKTQFEFSPLDQPLGLQGDTAKNILQFQSYNMSQVRMLKNMIHGMDDSMFVKQSDGTYKVSGLAAWKIARLVGANMLFITTVGASLGMKPEDMIPYSSELKDGSIPQSPIVKLLFGDTGTAGLTTLASDIKDLDADKLVKDTGSFAKSAAGLLIPGGTQAKKTLDATQANMSGFSENTSGDIRFAQDQDNMSKLNTTIFGQYTSQAGKDWIKQGFPTLTEKQTEDVYSQPDDAVKRQYAQFYETIKSVNGRQEAYDKAQAKIESGNTNAARKIIAEYNALVDDNMSSYYSSQKELPKELQDYLEGKVKIKLENLTN